MEQLLIDIPNLAVGNSIKAYLKTQKGVKFKVFDDMEKFHNDQIISISNEAHKGQEGIDWETAKDIFRSKV
jgi:hypothetical protein